MEVLMKNKYEAPVFERVEVESEDVITTSGIKVEETSETSADYRFNIKNLFK